MEEKKIIFDLPDDTIIWRYMNLEKYIDLLKSQSLFFCRADNLQDQFEGATPNTMAQLRKSKSCYIRPGFYTEDGEKQVSALLEPTTIEINKLLKKKTFINCWHINNKESDNMWRIYTDQNKGIAIKSSIGKLKKFLLANKYSNIFIGQVEYIDYENYNFEGFDVLIYERFFYKRESYAHEKEVRVIIQFLPEKYGDLIHFDALEALKEQENYPHIKFPSISSNVETLIDSVYISPYSTQLFKNTINAITKKYYPNLKIKCSDLENEPLY